MLACDRLACGRVALATWSASSVRRDWLKSSLRAVPRRRHARPCGNHIHRGRLQSRRRRCLRRRKDSRGARDARTGDDAAIAPHSDGSPAGQRWRWKRSELACIERSHLTISFGSGYVIEVSRAVNVRAGRWRRWNQGASILRIEHRDEREHRHEPVPRADQSSSRRLRRRHERHRCRTPHRAPDHVNEAALSYILQQGDVADAVIEGQPPQPISSSPAAVERIHGRRQLDGSRGTWSPTGVDDSEEPQRNREKTCPAGRRWRPASCDSFHGIGDWPMPINCRSS